MESTVIASSVEDLKLKQITEKFIKRISALADVINSQGYSIKAYSTSALNKLHTLSEETIHSKIREIEANIILIENSVTSISEARNRYTIKNLLNIMKLKAPADFVSSITDEDIVEIYSPESIQMFRNLKFYETTSYTLADLLLYEWHELYSRPTKIYETLAEYGAYCATKAKKDEVISMDHVPTHIIKEIKSTPINLLEVKFGKIAPVFASTGEHAGLIVTCRAKSMLSYDQEGIDFI